MESSPAFLCLWLCFIVYASTSNGCSEIPVVENAEVSESSKKNQYSEGDTLEYNCERGYISQRKITYRCTNNEWKIFRDVKCSLKPCESPEDILNGRYIIEKGRNFVFGTTIKYICNDGYQIKSQFDTRTCQEGGWDNQLPECKDVSSCERIVPERNIRVAGLPEHSDDLIRSGRMLTFSCDGPGLILQGQKVITCQSNGEWSSPLPKCVATEIACEGEQLINVEILYGHPSFVSPYTPGHVLLFRCTDENQKMHGHRAIACQSDGKWDQPYPTCRGRGKCGPPPTVDNGDTTDITKKEYNTGERVEYICFSKYTLDTRPTFSKYLTCQQGEWSGNVKCLKPCTVTVDIMNERGIELAYTGDQKMFAPHDDHITFKCLWGKRSVGVDFRQKCNDGEMTLPECV
ncbi:complement factor H-like [Carassius carassius]|uniref:complement factor H-like n=1 Tax=Carassius carassius TaxID=217509 RepID=UPI0028683C0D|nr:complement factor H-like [Carassius carassius]